MNNRHWPSVLVTGADGAIGSVLAAAWPADRFRGLDLPDGDVRDPATLARAAPGCDSIVHLAWDMAETFQSGRVAEANLTMTLNVLEGAVEAGVRRVVLASSVHAHAFWPPPSWLVDPRDTPVPDSPYGASKIWMEAAGRHFAAHHGLEVVAIRFGGVNPENRPWRADHNPARATWLAHRDCVSAVYAALTDELPASRYALMVAVSDSPFRVHEFSDDLQWRPQPWSLRSHLGPRARARARLWLNRIRRLRA